jgi:hypothetical protein
MAILEFHPRETPELGPVRHGAGEKEAMPNRCAKQDRRVCQQQRGPASRRKLHYNKAARDCKELADLARPALAVRPLPAIMKPAFDRSCECRDGLTEAGRLARVLFLT